MKPVHNKILDNFFVLEGLDGAGTTTQLKLLEQVFKERNIKYFLTQEPTLNPTGLLIRRFLSGEIPVSQSTIARAFATDRDDHLYNPKYGIIKHLQQNEIVISDRYLFSSVAYQSINFDKDEVIKMNCTFPLPCLLFYIDTPLDFCLSRIESRGMNKEIYERKDYLEQVKNNYEKYINQITDDTNNYATNRFSLIKIDGKLSIEKIHSIITREILHALYNTN